MGSSWSASANTKTMAEGVVHMLVYAPQAPGCTDLLATCAAVLADETKASAAFLAAQGEASFINWSTDQQWRYLHTNKQVGELLNDLPEEQKQLLPLCHGATMTRHDCDRVYGSRLLGGLVYDMFVDACSFRT